ncbi:hypothetical protein [Candidatus Nitrospira salsa]
MVVRLTSALIIATIGGVLMFVPVSGFAGSAQDAFKKLQGQQNGSGIKAHSASSAGKATGESGAEKEKAKKAMKNVVNKGSKKSQN